MLLCHLMQLVASFQVKTTAKQDNKIYDKIIYHYYITILIVINIIS